jgi:hypothetical protein
MKKSLLMTVLAFCAASNFAATAFFDFATGPGPGLSTVSSGGVWTVDNDGPSLRISKLADDGGATPNAFSSGGVVSDFTLGGNFLVTIDFTHFNFPAAGPNGAALNESVLSVSGNANNEGLSVLRYNSAGASRIEAFGGAPIGDQASSLSAGRYQIERQYVDRTIRHGGQ